MRTSGARSLPTVSDGQRSHFSSNRRQRKAPLTGVQYRRLMNR